MPQVPSRLRTYREHSGIADLCRNEGQVTQASFTTTLADGNWHHIALVRSATDKTWKFYRAGALASSVSISTSSPLTVDANGFVLGQNQTAVGVYSNSDKFQGNMGEFSIFRRALNDAQIDSMYRSGVTGTESDLALYLPMKDMVGETLVDRSTQARDGRIVVARCRHCH